MARIALCVLLFIMLSGCKSVATKMEAFLGWREVDLLSSWGAPDRTTEAGGKKFHSWDIRDGFGRVRCHGTFIINSAGKVVNYSTNC